MLPHEILSKDDIVGEGGPTGRELWIPGPELVGKAAFQSRERCPRPVPSPWGLVPLTLPLHEKPAGNAKARPPALLQGGREFGWGPSFPIVACRRLWIIAYIIFSSLQIINSLQSVDILPSSSLSLSLPLTHTLLTHSLWCSHLPSGSHSSALCLSPREFLCISCRNHHLSSDS